MTACDLTLIENFENYVKQQGLARQHLDDLATQLLRLKSDLSAKDWQDFCRGPFQKQLFALQNQPLLLAWERDLPSMQGRLRANSLFAFEIRELIRMLPGARILALGDSQLHPVDFSGAEQASFACDLRVEDTLLRRYSSAPSKRFDFIYTSDWLNRSNDARAIEWLKAATGLLRASGRLLASNLMPGAADAAYLEARWGAWPVYRDEQDLANLASQLTDEGLRGHAVFRDDAACMTFLEIQAA